MGSNSIATAIRQADRGYEAVPSVLAVHKAFAVAYTARAAVKPAAAKANDTGWLSSDPWVVSLM